MAALDSMVDPVASIIHFLATSGQRRLRRRVGRIFSLTPPCKISEHPYACIFEVLIPISTSRPTILSSRLVNAWWIVREA
jgi:hypothetical protein